MLATSPHIACIPAIVLLVHCDLLQIIYHHMSTPPSPFGFSWLRNLPLPKLFRRHRRIVPSWSGWFMGEIGDTADQLPNRIFPRALLCCKQGSIVKLYSPCRPMVYHFPFPQTPQLYKSTNYLTPKNLFIYQIVNPTIECQYPTCIPSTCIFTRPSSLLSLAVTA